MSEYVNLQPERFAATGTRLCLRLLGYDNVSVYDGSWGEWSKRSDLPVATGDA
jgi:thiosulfate/3-mercaptopyruvate sulfurtransferase